MNFQLYSPDSYRPWRDNFAIACSGGYDSMAIAAFFKKGGYRPTLLHINHNTGNDAAASLVSKFAVYNALPYEIHHINSTKPADESWEEYWRNERYAVFSSFNGPVITGHHLDDAMETWLFSSMHGKSKLIPYNTRNVYRPFLLNRKEQFLDYVQKHNIEYFEDRSNNNVDFPRNRIRHNVLPEVEKINSGFEKVIRKKYLQDVTPEL